MFGRPNSTNNIDIIRMYIFIQDLSHIYANFRVKKKIHSLGLCNLSKLHIGSKYIRLNIVLVQLFRIY